MENHESEQGMASAGVQHLAQLVHASMEAETQSVLTSGRAVQKIEYVEGELFVALEPRNPNAAPLDVSIDTDNQVTCIPGKNEMTYEIFSRIMRRSQKMYEHLLEL